MPFELAVILGISALGIGYDAFAGLVYWSFENYHPSGNIMWNTISMLGINWGIWFCLLGVFFCVAEIFDLYYRGKKLLGRTHNSRNADPLGKGKSWRSNMKRDIY